MKKLVIELSSILALLVIVACGDDNDDNLPVQAQVTLNFTHNWAGAPVTGADFNDIKFTNANGEMLSIERLRYLISNVTFTNTTSGAVQVVNGYNLVNLGENTGLTYTLDTPIPTGTYAVSFTFGFNNEDNAQNYVGLNSANFNVPQMMGGGYHYMQFDGKYIDSNDAEMPFNYHAIRAVNVGGDPMFPQDTFFTVNLGDVGLINNTILEVKMNIDQWFVNPNTWDLNVLDTPLMPNSAAQIMISENGQSGVFTLGAVTQ